jgi:hypothetical protein
LPTTHRSLKDNFPALLMTNLEELSEEIEYALIVELRWRTALTPRKARYRKVKSIYQKYKVRSAKIITRGRRASRYRSGSTVRHRLRERRSPVGAFYRFFGT